MADRSTEHWYPTAAYLYTLHLDGSALAWEFLRRTGATGCAAAGIRMQRCAGACVCWKIPAWMRAMRTRPGSRITMQWFSSIPMPTHRPMR